MNQKKNNDVNMNQKNIMSTLLDDVNSDVNQKNMMSMIC